MSSILLALSRFVNRRKNGRPHQSLNHPPAAILALTSSTPEAAKSLKPPLASQTAVKNMA